MVSGLSYFPSLRLSMHFKSLRISDRVRVSCLVGNSVGRGYVRDSKARSSKDESVSLSVRHKEGGQYGCQGGSFIYRGRPYRGRPLGHIRDDDCTPAGNSPFPTTSTFLSRHLGTLVGAGAPRACGQPARILPQLLWTALVAVALWRLGPEPDSWLCDLSLGDGFTHQRTQRNC